jgi:hypothetical protein
MEIDGVRIAQRGLPGSPQAKTWVSLEPGWKVTDVKDNKGRTFFDVEYCKVKVH